MVGLERRGEGSEVLAAEGGDGVYEGAFAADGDDLIIDQRSDGADERATGGDVTAEGGNGEGAGIEAWLEDDGVAVGGYGEGALEGVDVGDVLGDGGGGDEDGRGHQRAAFEGLD